jgi:hypothetical protein
MCPIQDKSKNGFERVNKGVGSDSRDQVLSGAQSDTYPGPQHIRHKQVQQSRLE